MILEEHLIHKFGSLPYLPRAEIARHFGICDKIKLMTVSSEWNKLFVSDKPDPDDPLFMKLSTKDHSAEIRILQSRMFRNEVLSIEFRVDREKSVEMTSEKSIICYSPTLRTCKKRVTEMFKRLRFNFHLEAHMIQVNFAFGFSLEFLKSITVDKTVCVYLEGGENNPVHAKTLEKILKKMKPEIISINAKTVGEFEGQDYLLNCFKCAYGDARWLTSDMLLWSVDSVSGRFRQCRLTSQDFNQYLKNFIAGFKVATQIAEFHCQSVLNIRKILKGLDAKSWDPEVRERKYIDGWTYSDKFVLTDLSDGFDIISREETPRRGTVHLSSDRKVLKFFVWSEHFPAKMRKQLYMERTERLKEMLKDEGLSAEQRENVENRKEKIDRKLQYLINEM